MNQNWNEAQERLYFEKIYSSAINEVSTINDQNLGVDDRKIAINKASELFFGQFLSEKNAEFMEEKRFIKRSLDLLRSLYGHGGVFAGATIAPHGYLPREELLKYAVITHLLIREPDVFSQLDTIVFSNLFYHQLAYEGKFKALAKHVEEIGKVEPSTSLTEVMGDINRNAHRYTQNYRTIAALQDKGGVQFLISHDADIKLSLKSIIQCVEGTEANNSSFSKMFKISIDCTKILESKGELSVEESEYIKSCLLRNALEVSGRQKKKSPEVWGPIIQQVSQSVDRALSVRNLLSYLNYLPSSEHSHMVVALLAEVDKVKLKQYIKRDYDESSRYDLVVKSGIQYLFTENELLIMCGNRFANDLGI